MCARLHHDTRQRCFLVSYLTKDSLKPLWPELSKPAASLSGMAVAMQARAKNLEEEGDAGQAKRIDRFYLAASSNYIDILNHKKFKHNNRFVPSQTLLGAVNNYTMVRHPPSTMHLSSNTCAIRMDTGTHQSSSAAGLIREPLCTFSRIMLLPAAGVQEGDPRSPSSAHR